MEVSITRDDEQKNNPANLVAADLASQNKKAASTHRESGERAHTAGRDPGAAQKLARKKRMKRAHRRRLKASHAKG